MVLFSGWCNVAKKGLGAAKLSWRGAMGGEGAWARGVLGST